MAQMEVVGMNTLNFALLWIIGGDLQWQLPNDQTIEKSNWEVVPLFLPGQCRNKGPYLDPLEKKFPGNINSCCMEYSDVVWLLNTYDMMRPTEAKGRERQVNILHNLFEYRGWGLSPESNRTGVRLNHLLAAWPEITLIHPSEGEFTHLQIKIMIVSS